MEMLSFNVTLIVLMYAKFAIELELTILSLEHTYERFIDPVNQR